MSHFSYTFALSGAPISQDDETCGSCSRNGNQDAPPAVCAPRMSDGRLFTDYRPRFDTQLLSLQTDAARAGHEVSNSFAYRQYLINNAEQLMAKQRTQTLPCCDIPYSSPGTMLPEQSIMQCDASSCSVIGGDSAGLGMGRAAAPGTFPPEVPEPSGVPEGVVASTYMPL